MKIPRKGQKAPDFTLLNESGSRISLKEFKGKSSVILYFYPKDDTPGCTVEACGFRDGLEKIRKTGAVVIGISPDPPSSHQKFIEKFNLPFTLLSDEEKTVCKAYGVWVKKSMYGKEYMGVDRTTFIIGKNGDIKKVYEKVKPDGHVDEVLSVLASDGSG